MTSLPTGAAARTKRRVTDTAAFVASAATPTAASTASGTVACRRGSGMRLRHA